MNSRKKIIIIGAGPIGLEAALYAAELGYETEVVEKGEIGENIQKWGHVTLFSPWEINHSKLGVSQIKKHHPAWVEPDKESYQTGQEFVTSYLRPLSRLPQLREKIHTGVDVIAIGKQGLLKSELIGSAERTTRPFRLLTRKENGKEQVLQADVVIDATGVYGNPNWLGDGGIPAPGELQSRPFIDYVIRDVYGSDRAEFANKKTLLVGAGYSAATTVCAFQNLIREEPGTSLIWAIRQDRKPPVPHIKDDPLPNRAALTEQANRISASTQQIEFRNNTVIESVHYRDKSKTFSAVLNTNGETEKITVDRVIANVGYGPDNSLYRELQVHECYASRGPMKLAASLLSSTSADCMEQTSAGADTLKNPEPDFYIIGNKSYGRNPTFLLRIGLAQIVELFTLITGNEKLNLYQQTEKERI